MTTSSGSSRLQELVAFPPGTSPSSSRFVGGDTVPSDTGSERTAVRTTGRRGRRGRRSARVNALRIVRADLKDTQHQAAVLKMTRAYAQDRWATVVTYLRTFGGFSLTGSARIRPRSSSWLFMGMMP